MPAVRAEYAALLRRPRYPSFLLTVSLSRMTGAMFITSGVLLVLGRTGSAGLAGLTAAASTLPGALSGPVLGAWLDVARRRRVLIVVDQLLSVVALLAILALAGHAPDWTVPAVAVLYSVTRPFSSGSFVSALAEVAGPELLERASAIEATSLNLGIVVGPALAGGLVGAIGAPRRGRDPGGPHGSGGRADRRQPGVRGARRHTGRIAARRRCARAPAPCSVIGCCATSAPRRSWPT